MPDLNVDTFTVGRALTYDDVIRQTDRYDVVIYSPDGKPHFVSRRLRDIENPILRTNFKLVDGGPKRVYAAFDWEIEDTLDAALNKLDELWRQGKIELH